MTERPNDEVPRSSAQIDAAYTTVYDEHPLDEPDEWGDLGSFHTAAGASQLRHLSPD